IVKAVVVRSMAALCGWASSRFSTTGPNGQRFDIASRAPNGVEGLSASSIQRVGPSSVAGSGDASIFSITSASLPMAVYAGGVDERPPFPFTVSSSESDPFSLTPMSATLPGTPSIEPAAMAPSSSSTSAAVLRPRATSGAVLGVETVNVTAGPPASITVSPNPTTLATGLTQQFTAVGKDASGNVVAITPAWAVVAGGGSINGSGLFTPGTYNNTVQAIS